jgi:phospholipid-binding lipoprotein MlaA
MNSRPAFLLLLAAALLGLGGCAGRERQPAAAAAPAGDGKTTAADVDDLDEYSAAGIADPIEPVNRAIFAFNHGLYLVLLRPIARGYEIVVPKPVRRGIHNAYDNVRFPVRFVNSLLQAKFPQAGRETGKFLVNSTAGIGGIMRVSDRIPALADVPAADTGQTFAKWGVDHGFYLVLPVLGPNSLRDTVGTAGDAALNPITWVGFLFGGGYLWGGPNWTSGVSAGNTLRGLPDQMDAYDSVTENSLEKYIAARTAYVQFREAKAKE